MSSTITVTARRFVLTLSVAGIAALGGIAVAPAASAAEGSDSVVVREGVNGPDAFVLLEHGRIPVFECDADHSNQQHNNCIDVTGPTRF
jgi:hypothetical protein